VSFCFGIARGMLGGDGLGVNARAGHFGTLAGGTRAGGTEEEEFTEKPRSCGFHLGVTKLA
jgi:hypothetical protein